MVVSTARCSTRRRRPTALRQQRARLAAKAAAAAPVARSACRQLRPRLQCNKDSSCGVLIKMRNDASTPCATKSSTSSSTRAIARGCKQEISTLKAAEHAQAESGRSGDFGLTHLWHPAHLTASTVGTARPPRGLLHCRQSQGAGATCASGRPPAPPPHSPSGAGAPVS